ncbi:MAG: HlyD family efflux transporter periplasmic adaptor subunit [Chlamydiota bacterium]|nr:HlyD family efflux transporter periplasmic adaptor subunit [Chlamydiota bacterium]
MTQTEGNQNQQMLQHMATINRLNLKAFDTKKRQTLIFSILNETIHAIRYDRAVLWDMEKKHPKLLGVSGQSEPNKDARLTKQWLALVSAMNTPEEAQLLTPESITGETHIWNDYEEGTKASVIWLPIKHDNKLVLGLWLEIFGKIQNPESVKNTLDFLTTYLTPAYGIAWDNLKPKFAIKEKAVGKKPFMIGLFSILLASLIIQVPLRVVAPCEIVANDPILITAPLDGIIEEITVDPGDSVLKDDVLIEYDKRVPLRNLKVAQKEVEILKAEANRARTLGLDDKKSRTELGILNLKLEKEKVNLNLAKWQASKLTVKAPNSGVVMLDNPDTWRGKPVQVGEKILSINDPQNTKIRIWIPESDNVVLDPDKPIKVFLNINPEESYTANIIYIANESGLSDDYLPSFVAEANWVDQPDDIKLGLKGTSILYGERVSLLYYFIRKPWAAVRSFLGI